MTKEGTPVSGSRRNKSGERKQRIKHLPAQEARENAFMTVETAMLMPIIFLTIFLAVYLSAHVHGRTCLYERAAEQAVSGHKQDAGTFFALTTPKKTETGTKKKRVVRYTASSAYLDNTSFLSIDEEAEYQIDEPVKRLRKAQAARNALSDVVK